MILFWLICAVFVVIALAFVLPPVLQRDAQNTRETDDERKEANIAVYRDQLSELKSDLANGIVSQQQYDQDREEIERRLLEDTTASAHLKTLPALAGARNTVYVLALGLPLVAIIFYLQIGNPKSVAEVATITPGSQSTEMGSGQRTQEQIEANVTALAKRLQTNPSDVQGWTMLARSYSSMERFGEAAGAYAKATELSPKDADLWAEYAFSTAMASGRKLEGKPTELINQALKVDPENAKALQLAGSAAFEARDYKKAVDYWQRVLSKVPPDSEVGQTITARINEAKSLAVSK
jgi:cytochrome c-type biogenesis protein CcmH